MDLSKEKQVFERAKTDPEAFGELFEKYYSPILNYVLRRVYDLQAAQDITSDIFLIVFQKLWQFQWRNIPFLAWLYRISGNEVRYYFRKKKHRHLSLDHLLQEEDLSMTFRSEALVVIAGQRGKWVEVWLENDEIVNQEELKEKFYDPHLEDELLQFIIQQQNQHFLENMREYEPRTPHMSENILDSLELILHSANVPIIDQSRAFN